MRLNIKNIVRRKLIRLLLCCRWGVYSLDFPENSVKFLWLGKIEISLDN